MAGGTIGRFESNCEVNYRERLLPGVHLGVITAGGEIRVGTEQKLIVDVRRTLQ